MPFPALRNYKILNIEDPYSSEEFEVLNTADCDQKFIIMAFIPTKNTKIANKTCWDESDYVRKLIAKKVQYMVMIDARKEVKLQDLPAAPLEYFRPVTKL